MDYREFSAKIKSKYPDYADMDDRELAQKMVKKFPNDYSDVTFDAPATQKEPTPIRDALGIDSTASIGTQVAQGASLPFRGTRGLAVAASQALPTLMSPVRAAMNPGETVNNLGQAVQRGAEATRPGFKPEGFTETVASAIGEAGPLLPVGGLVGTGLKGAAAAAGVGAGAGAAQSALMQQSERGSIDIGEVGITAALSGIVPSLPIIIKTAWPTVASRLTKVTPEAFEKLMDDPNFLKKVSGSVEQVQKRANVVFDAFKRAENGVKRMLDNVEEYHSFRPNAAEAREAADAGPMSLKKIYESLDEIKGRMRDKVVKTTFEPASGVAKKEIQKAYTPREKIVRLVRLDRELNNITRGSLDADTKLLKDKIKAEITKVPGGKYYQKVRTMWSDFMDVASKLSSNLKDESASRVVVEKLARGDISGALSVGNAKAFKAIRELEKMTGLPSSIEPLKDELMAGMLKKNLPTSGRDYVERALMFAFPKAAIPAILASSPRLMAGATSVVRQLPAAGSAITPAIPGLLRGDR